VKRSAAESVAFTARTTAAARQNLTPAHRALWNALRLTPGWHREYNVVGTTKNGGRFPYRLDCTTRRAASRSRWTAASTPARAGEIADVTLAWRCRASPPCGSPIIAY